MKICWSPSAPHSGWHCVCVPACVIVSVAFGRRIHRHWKAITFSFSVRVFRKSRVHICTKEADAHMCVKCCFSTGRFVHNTHCNQIKNKTRKHVVFRLFPLRVVNRVHLNRNIWCKLKVFRNFWCENTSNWDDKRSENPIEKIIGEAGCLDPQLVKFATCQHGLFFLELFFHELNA